MEIQIKKNFFPNRVHNQKSLKSSVKNSLEKVATPSLSLCTVDAWVSPLRVYCPPGTEQSGQALLGEEGRVLSRPSPPPIRASPTTNPTLHRRKPQLREVLPRIAL